MASENYQEHLAAERTERTRKMLQSLPLSCTDFITSIAMTTSPLTRLAYTIDLGTFCEFASREIPYYAEKKPSEWTDADIDHFTGRDLRTYADYLTLYFKDETLSEGEILIGVNRGQEYPYKTERLRKQCAITNAALCGNCRHFGRISIFCSRPKEFLRISPRWFRCQSFMKSRFYI